ncbi:MAG: hypothetical protein IRZ32_01670 [Solirubrobacteraceae bacterium]|nr:hypothetical protein [Solirubrobacteraceae bacterium]
MTVRRLARTVAVAAGAVAIGAGSADAAIRVWTPEGQELVRFRTLTCRVDGAGFHGRAVVRGWRLNVRIQPFSGFKRYPLEYGLGEQLRHFFLDPPGGGETYSNAQEPPPAAARLTLGGSIQFPGGRKRIRIAFPVTYDRSEGEPSIVRVVGTAACSWRRR